MSDEALNPTPLPDDEDAGQIVSAERVLELLTKGSISEARGRLRWSSNYTFLVMVCDDDLQTRAIYKPQRGERPLWDFPDGTLCYRETAAYVVSHALGWGIVPPTVLREGPHGIGSVQLYVEHEPDVTYFNLDDSFTPQLQRFALFDYITNNADRKGGHCLLAPDGKLWGIDHGICFHAAPKMRTVIWDYAGKPIPDEMIHEIECFAGEASNAEGATQPLLKKLLSAHEIEAVIRRSHQLLKSRKFPMPGHGPNYPWPPV